MFTGRPFGSPQASPRSSPSAVTAANAMAGGSFIVYQIWPELTFFTAVAVMVYCVNELTDTKMTFQPSLISVLGTVLGLVISFRTTSAYDRYWEGRKLWTTIALSSRNLANLIWIHVPTDRSAKAKTPLPKDAQLRVLIEKKSMINLVQAFSAALKHYLRGETGVYYEDVYPLVAFLPQYTSGSNGGERVPLWSDYSNSAGYHVPRTDEKSPEGSSTDPFKRKKKRGGFDPEGALPSVAPEDLHLAPARLPPKIGFFELLPVFMPIKALYKFFKRMLSKLNDNDMDETTWTGKKVQRPIVESVVPLEIILHLSSYWNFLMQEGLLQSAAATSFNNNLQFLQDASVQLRRIATTPIPFAYQAHLRMATWLYLFFLPFQITTLGWIIIPATTFAAFLYLGFLEIGAEIENPFGYDENDLNVDSYCLSIAREIAEITAHNPAPPSTYIFSANNQPFAPADRRTAYDLTTDMEGEYFSEGNGMDTLRATLVRGWKNVSEMTRDDKVRVSA